MTRVSTTKTFEKQLTKCPQEIRRKALGWIFSVQKFGIRYMRKIPGHHDEPLRGKRQGQRSIRLSRSYRLIYREVNKCVHIQLLEINRHDY